MNAAIQKLRQENAAVFAEALRRADLLNLSLAQILSALDGGQVFYFIEENQALIAVMLLLPLPDEVELLDIVVAKTHRRRGFASQLLHFAADIFAQKSRILLEVRDSNAAARAFYAHLGFSALARRKHYYPTANGREDAHILAWDLPKN